MTLHPHIPASTEALYRFTVISQVLTLEKGGEKRADAVKNVAHRLHMKLDEQTRSNGKRTIYRWLAAYEAEGISGLEPATRPHTESSDVLTERFIEFFRTQKEADPRASIPELIRRAVATGILKSEDDVCRQTVWRAARRLNVETRRRKKKKDRDARRFRYPHRMQMMLCDGKHFRAGAERLRRVALFFLDDATRYGLHVVVGTSENSALFLRGLYEVVRQYGWMDITFLDNGPGFKNDDTTAVVKNVHSLLVLGTVAYPEGHGAIERFNQTAEAAILRHFDKRPDVDPDCGALELRLQHYLREVYNRTPHEGLDGWTPEARWEKDGRTLRHFSTDAELRSQFVITETRRVSSAEDPPWPIPAKPSIPFPPVPLSWPGDETSLPSSALMAVFQTFPLTTATRTRSRKWTSEAALACIPSHSAGRSESSTSSFFRFSRRPSRGFSGRSRNA